MADKRLGIFAFYEKEGIVEDYVLYLLEDLTKCLERLVIVCNGNLSKEGRQKFANYSEDIYVRNNIGYDIGAFREVLIDSLGQKIVCEYDELVLCNDTFFGPFEHFSDIFHSMEEKKLDFWGLSSQPETIDFWTATDRIVPAFVQSFFMVIQNRMMQDTAFWDYWEKIQAEKWNVTQLVINHEQYFTPYFESLGYKWGTYTDCSFIEGSLHENAYTPYLMLPYELIKYGNAPFLKKKSITGKDVSQQMEADNGSFRKAIDYIDKNTDYDIDLILGYMLRNCGKQRILEKLQLSYILSGDKEDKPFTDYNKVAIIVAMKDLACIQFVDEYLSELPKEILCIQDYEIEKAISNLPDKVEYICVLQEIRNTNREGNKNDSIPKCTIISANRLLCENMIFNTTYISNVICCLQEDKYLGMLLAPVMRFDGFLDANEDVCDWIKGSFWIKRKAIAADMEGYYAGRIFRDRCAGLELLNEDCLMKEMFTISGFGNRITDFTSYFEQKLFDACRRYTKIYLYGAGGVGQRTLQILQKENIQIEGFVVSDGQMKDKDVSGYDIYYLSEVIENNPDIHNVGIIIAVEGRIAEVVQENLLKYGIKGYTLWN